MDTGPIGRRYHSELRRLMRSEAAARARWTRWFLIGTGTVSVALVADWTLLCIRTYPVIAEYLGKAGVATLIGVVAGLSMFTFGSVWLALRQSRLAAIVPAGLALLGNAILLFAWGYAFSEDPYLSWRIGLVPILASASLVCVALSLLYSRST